MRHLRQQQMLCNQKLNKGGVGAVEAVISAESPGIAAAQVAVIAATALCNVVKDRSDVEHPGSVEVRHQLASQRILVRMFR